MSPRGRPKHVARGTERRPFEWLGAGDAGPTIRFCTASWMRHGDRVAAVATYRNVAGLDVQYLGMAQGPMDGPFFAAGHGPGVPIRELLGRPPLKERDAIEACVILAVRSLEHAVAQAARGDADDHSHPWRMAGKNELEAHRFARARARRDAEA